MRDQKLTWEEAVRWCLEQPDMKELAEAAYFGDAVRAAKAYSQSKEFAEIRRLIGRTPGRALDLGAGNGVLSWALAREGWQVTAVEPDPSELVGANAIRDLSKRTDVPLTVVEAFGEAIPLEEAGFDLVVARQVLHHAHDLRAFCNEMFRLARPGATILTLRDHVISDAGQLDAFLDAHPLHHLYQGENAFTLAEYRSSLRAAGLHITREFRSFQSVINYDPMSEDFIIAKLASRTGLLESIARTILTKLPFKLVAEVATKLDRRPGRLVSFLCRRADQ